jgi:hypothetical protein
MCCAEAGRVAIRCWQNLLVDHIVACVAQALMLLLLCMHCGACAANKLLTCHHGLPMVGKYIVGAHLGWVSCRLQITVLAAGFAHGAAMHAGVGCSACFFARVLTNIHNMVLIIFTWYCCVVCRAFEGPAHQPAGAFV